MAVLKCKMCGADLNVDLSVKVCECEYCGSHQTLPKNEDEEKTRLFNRATQLRHKYEFDKAASVYESIISIDNKEPEAYWGLVLCRYGIEYIDDPKTKKKIPVCSIMRYESLNDDFDVKTTLMYAEDDARTIYQSEISSIETLRKKVIDVSYKEKPYDVFICYKASDEEGNRSKESVIGKDYYDELTDKGYRVFFAEVSLEGKLGFEYEPYIFAALNSAKVMIVIGTNNSNLESIWVRNEWERYLSIMAKDRSRLIIPCYSEMEAYDLPDEFSSLQALNADKLGSKQDLISAIVKAIPKGKQENELTTEKVQKEIITTIRYENKRRSKKTAVLIAFIVIVASIGLIYGVKTLLKVIEENKSTTIIDNTKTVVQEKDNSQTNTINNTINNTSQSFVNKKIYDVYSFQFDELPIVLEDRLYGGDINKFQITDINYQSNATDYGYEIADGYCEIELKGNYLSHTDEDPYVLGDIYFSIYFYDKAGHIVYEGMDAIRYGEGEVTCKVDLYDFSLPIGDYKVVIELYNY